MRTLAALRQDGADVWLDGGGRYRVALDGQGRAVSARFGGAALPIVRAPEGDALIAHGIALVSPDTPLRAVVQLRQSSGHPVLLEDGGVLVGVCDDAEMLGALCGVARTPTEAAVA